MESTLKSSMEIFNDGSLDDFKVIKDSYEERNNFDKPVLMIICRNEFEVIHLSVLKEKCPEFYDNFIETAGKINAVNKKLLCWPLKRGTMPSGLTVEGHFSLIPHFNSYSGFYIYLNWEFETVKQFVQIIYDMELNSDELIILNIFKIYFLMTELCYSKRDVFLLRDLKLAYEKVVQK